jgi:hypothetical protein
LDNSHDNYQRYTVSKIKTALTFFVAECAQPLKVTHNQRLIIFETFFVEAKHIKHVSQKIGSLRPIPC